MHLIVARFFRNCFQRSPKSYMALEIMAFAEKPLPFYLSFFFQERAVKNIMFYMKIDALCWRLVEKKQSPGFFSG